jgi:T4 beta protein
VFSIAQVDYSVVLRGKAGEFLALEKLRDPIKDRVAPMIVLPSLSIKDLEKHRTLRKGEAPRIFAERIAKCWKARPFFLEARFLRFDTDEGKDGALLNKLLLLCGSNDCNAIPAISLKTSSARLHVFKDYMQRSGSGLALRVSLSDLNRQSLESEILAFLTDAGVLARNCVLFVDLSDAAIVDKRAFAELIVSSVGRFREVGSWARTILAASNFPDANPAAKNGHAIISRLEWAAWQEATKLGRGLNLA